MEIERLLSSLHTPRPADQRNEGRVGIALLVDRRHGILLVSHKVHKLTGSNILVMPIMTIQLSTGEVIYRANFFLHSTNEVEFLEVFEEYIFIKQREHRLVVFSVLSPFFTYSKMLKNKIVSLENKEGLDAKLIVFLNYQSIFLVFSRSSIDIYNSLLKKTNSFPTLLPFIVDSPRTANMQTTHTTTLHSSP